MTRLQRIPGLRPLDNLAKEGLPTNHRESSSPGTPAALERRLCLDCDRQQDADALEAAAAVKDASSIRPGDPVAIRVAGAGAFPWPLPRNFPG
jgi:hypothetical protein